MSFAFRAAVFSVSLIILYSTTAQARFGTPSRPSKETVAEPVAEEAAAPIPSPDPDLAFESTHFSGSGNCSSCHDGLRDNRGVDLSIGRAWSATMMAHATRDPVFQAKFASEVKRHPALGPVLSAKCLRCHAPMASVDADYDGSQLTLLDG